MRLRSSVGVVSDQVELGEHAVDPRYELVLVAQHDRVFDQVLLVLGVAALLERADAVGAVVLQVGDFGLDGVRRARAAETRQREVIVQRQDLLHVVETLDVLVRLRVVGAAVDVLQHVHVARNGRLPLVRVLLSVRPEIPNRDNSISICAPLLYFLFKEINLNSY